MSTKTKETLTVISQEEIGRDIYSLWLQTDQMAQNARPGQFLSLYTGDGSKIIRGFLGEFTGRSFPNGKSCGI